MTAPPIDAAAVAEAHERLLDGNATDADAALLGRVVARWLVEQFRQQEATFDPAELGRAYVNELAGIGTDADRNRLFHGAAVARLLSIRRERARRAAAAAVTGSTVLPNPPTIDKGDLQP